MAETATARRSEVTADQILPLLFSGREESSVPALVLVCRAPGTVAAAATGRLLSEHGPGMAVVNGDELRALHPSSDDQSAEANEAVRAATAEWVRAALTFARENRRSVLLEGQFTATATLGLAQRYSGEGFRTRVVVCGARRAESLLWAVSQHLHAVRSGTRSRFVGREAVDRDFESARALAAAMEESGGLDRVTVLGRGGRSVWDVTRSEAGEAFVGVSAALQSVGTERLTGLESVQWLSELRRVTRFASTQRDLPPPVGEALIDLHETALREIIPELPVPAGSRAAAGAEGTVAADLVLLRRSLVVDRPVDAAGPVTGPAGPDRGGLSR
jgi:hypothetical protein